MVIFLVITVSYFLGAIPTGYLAGRLASIDIRTKGSGNPGATNVVRVLGKRYGYPVFVADLLKGLVAVLIGTAFATRVYGESASDRFGILAGIFCVLGHTFSVWLKFKGGKGVATSIGVITALVPLAAAVMLVVWLVSFQLTRYVSIASILSAVTLPITVGLLAYLRHVDRPLLLYFSLALAAVVVLRHHSNILRLVRGTEPRFNRSES